MSLFLSSINVVSMFAQAPDPPVQDGASPLPGFAIMALMAVVVIGISLMPSKRGHQD